MACPVEDLRGRPGRAVSWNTRLAFMVPYYETLRFDSASSKSGLCKEVVRYDCLEAVAGLCHDHLRRCPVCQPVRLRRYLAGDRCNNGLYPGSFIGSRWPAVRGDA